MFDSIQNIINGVRYDPDVRKRVIFWVASGVGVVILLVVIISINLRELGSDGIIGNNVEQTQLENNGRKVLREDFSSGEFARVINKPIGMSYPILAASGSRFTSISESGKLMINDSIIETSPALSAQSIYSTTEGTIINEFGRSTIFADGIFTQLSPGIQSVVPGFGLDPAKNRSIPVYFGVELLDGQLTILESSDILLKNDQKRLTSFKIVEGYTHIEIKIFNRQPYVLIYQNPVRQGNIEIYLLNTSNTLQKVQELTKVQSIQFFDRSLIATVERSVPTELTKYTQTLIDFGASVEGITKSIDFSTSSAKAKIYGSILAHRCTLRQQINLFCLVKERKVEHTELDENDRIIQYNIQTGEVTFPFVSAFFSADGIYSVPGYNEGVFILGAQDRLMYRLTGA